MNQDPYQALSPRWQILRTWLTAFAVIWLLGFIGLGWLVKSFLFLIGLITVAPILLFVGIRWWLGRAVVQSACPVCQYEFAALNNSQTQCPNCGESLQVEQRSFRRLTSPGTIDVQVVEVSSQVVDDE
jgi:anaerobic ribonucleoside-triphosphate reductase